MEKNGRKLLLAGLGTMAAFVIWTMLIQTVDVQPVGLGIGSEESVRRYIINTLNDFKLRCTIEEETKDIRTIIYAKAFADYTESNE